MDVFSVRIDDKDTQSILQDWDVENLKKYDVDLAFYWYADYGYDGDGDMILRSNGVWYLVSLSHCSCYGPTDDIVLRNGMPNPRDLVPQGQYAQKYVGALVDEVEKYMALADAYMSCDTEALWRVRYEPVPSEESGERIFKHKLV